MEGVIRKKSGNELIVKRNIPSFVLDFTTSMRISISIRPIASLLFAVLLAVGSIASAQVQAMHLQQVGDVAWQAEDTDTSSSEEGENEEKSDSSLFI